MPTSCELKEREAGLIVTAAGARAVPLSGTLCGEVEAEFAISRLVLRVPAAVGEKITEMLQLAPAANVVPQVLESWKSPACAPLNEMALMARLLPPLLERVTT